MKRKRNNNVAKAYPGGLVSDLPKVGQKTLLYAPVHVSSDVSRLSSDAVVVSLPTLANTGTGIVTGDEQNNRTSQRIRIKKVEAILHAYVSVSATDARRSFRTKASLYLDKQHNGAAVVPSTAAFFATKGGEHLPNISNRYRFKKLWSREVEPSYDEVYNGAAMVKQSYPSTLNINYTCDIPIMYDQTTGGGLQRLTSNNLYLVLEPMGTPDATAVVHVGGFLRLYYTS